MADFELPLLQVDSVLGFTVVEDPSNLVVVNRDPSPAETDIPLDSTIRLELVSFDGNTIALSTVRVWVNGALATSWNGSALSIAAPFNGPRCSTSHTSPRCTIVLDPLAGLPSLATIEVVVEASLTSGFLLREVYSFQVEDRTGPVLLGALALDERTVRVTFDEPVTVASAPAFTFAALGAPAVTPVVESVSVSGAVMDVLLDTELSPGIEYRVTATGVADAFGNLALDPFRVAEFTGFVPQSPPGRNFDLWSMLPKHNRADDQTGDLRKFIACLQDVATLLLYRVDRYVEIFDYERAPESFVDLILEDLGNPFRFDLTLDEKRRLASVLVYIYLQKGTKPGLINSIRFFLGIEVTVDQYLESGMVLGESLLGFDWELGPRGSFARYAFTVSSPVALTAEQRSRMRRIVNYIKPAHTHFVDLLEPPPAPYVPDHWEIGESLLGVESILHSLGAPQALLTESDEPLLTELGEPIYI